MSSISSTNLLSFTGLASGIDTNQIIQGLLQVQQASVNGLKTQEQGVAARQSAFQTIESQLLDLQNQIGALADPLNGAFASRTATSSNTAVVSAAASQNAVAGVYNFTVNSLAQAQQLASQGFASATSAISQGTYNVQIGNGATTSITINSSNDTLQGLATAINDSGAAVTASIVNDGSDARTQPNRLLLTADSSGAANTISINFTPDPSNPGGGQPEFNATTIADAVGGTANTSTAAFNANAGTGAYTGTSSDTYNFTVSQGGTIGSDPITINWTDANGHNGTINLDNTYTGGPIQVAQGVAISLGTGNLAQNDSFTVDAFNPNIQQAADASVTIGSGSGSGGGLTVSSPSNVVNNLISGVTLTLNSASPNTPVSVTVANDATGITTDLQNFVSSYNAVVTTLNTATAFNSTSQSAGLLLGNPDANGIEDQLLSIVGSAIGGVSEQANSLSAIGITFNNDGTLSLNGNTLNQALSGQLPGVSFSDLNKLFTLSGQSDNSAVQFITASNKTNESAIPYQVNITQAATQGSFTAAYAVGDSPDSGNSSPPATVNIDSGNDTLSLSVNGKSIGPLTIAQGSYTPLQLAQQLQSLINSDSALGGNTVAVTVNGGNLQFTSQTYGSGSTISVTGGTALDTLGLTGTETGKGNDVAGNFVVNGVTEQATGSGQILTGNKGNANTDGLVVRSTATQSTTANLTVTRGIASQLNQALNNLTDPVSGRLTTINSNYQTQITDLNTQITNANNAFTQQQQALTQQFASMEAAIAQLKIEGQTIAAEFGTNNSSSSSQDTLGTSPFGSGAFGGSSSGSSTTSSSSSSGSTSGSSTTGQ